MFLIQNSNFKKIFFYFSILCATFILVGCDSVIRLTVTRPAEVNLTRYKKIAVLEFKNPEPTGGGGRDVYGNTMPVENFGGAGTELSDALTTALIQSNLYEVLDRQNLDKILAEQQLSASGMASDSSALELGDIIATPALITGSVTTATYKEDPITSASYEEKRDNRLMRYTIRTRTGSMSYTANIKFTDATTSKIIATKTVSGNRSVFTQARDGTPASISSVNLYNEAKEKSVITLMRMMAPYNIEKSVTIKKDGEMPEINGIIQNLQIGNTQEGIKGLEELSQKEYKTPTIKAKALYNYAALLTYTGAPEKAATILQEVNKLDPGVYLYQVALQNAKHEIGVKAKMKEQNL